jgi:hypothetical protein
MGDIVNLNRVRKERARNARRKPGERHIKAGLTRAERTNLDRGIDRTEADLDGKKLDGPPESAQKSSPETLHRKPAPQEPDDC